MGNTGSGGSTGSGTYGYNGQPGFNDTSVKVIQPKFNEFTAQDARLRWNNGNKYSGQKQKINIHEEKDMESFKIMEDNVNNNQSVDEQLSTLELHENIKNTGDVIVNDLPMKHQIFKLYFYENVKSADTYYQSFVDKEFNDLDILMEFDFSDLSVLMDECHMNRIHAKFLLKLIKVLKESNEDFQQWLTSIGMRKKYYRYMIDDGIATLSMLEERFVCVTDFVIFLGGENDEEREGDGICIWENMPKNSKKKNENNNQSNNESTKTDGNAGDTQTDGNAGEGDEGNEGGEQNEETEGK